jgi:hypothetical protein
MRGNMSLARLVEIVDTLFRGKITNALRNINSDHSAIHEGEGFNLLFDFTGLTSLGKKVYRFVGPTTRFAHVKNLSFVGQGSQALIKIIKEATQTAPGTLLTDAIINKNDNSPLVPTSKLYENATYTGGKLWDFAKINGDTLGGSSSSGGNVNTNPNEELITKDENTVYFIEVENLTTDTLDHVYCKMFFYEELKGYAE